MVVGDPAVFAIESGITHAYARLSFRALGFFVIHIGGFRFGRRASDATLLACSRDEVERRIDARGSHVAAFADAPGSQLASAFRQAIYDPNPREDVFFGLAAPEFSALIHSRRLTWAPDGDEAFDDGSYVLQFDVVDRVRLVAFRCEDYGYDGTSLRDVWLHAADYYGVLEKWLDRFDAEWAATPKVADGNE